MEGIRGKEAANRDYGCSVKITTARQAFELGPHNPLVTVFSALCTD